MNKLKILIAFGIVLLLVGLTLELYAQDKHNYWYRIHLRGDKESK